MDSSFFLTTIAAATIGFLVTIFFLFYKKFRFHQANKTIASSSSLSPPPSVHHNWKHHVFPSFHGADVRKAFLSHILKEFRSKGIDPFIDNDIERSKSIGPELVQAIRGSKIAIVLLSKNYASSTWCMNELVEIMKFREEIGQIVITVFYEVDPTDVKKQTGDFGKVFKRTCKGKTKEDIGRWRQALAEVAKIAGYHSSNWDDEAAMIEKIAVDISNKLNIVTPSRDFDRLIGMGAHVERMKPLLRLDLDEVRMIGIWGPPGIGKSTIARFLFNQLSNSFQLSAIMVNIKGSYPQPCLDEGSAQLQLQNQMLSQMLNHKDMVITHLGVAQERLKNKKVFLVLDDVDRLAQLVALAEHIRWFGCGSRIIITTEDLRVLKAHGINHIYKVEFPTNDEALQIFCMYAFGQKSPKAGFMELAQEVTNLAGKLPLGLKVMGSYFRGMSQEEWKNTLPKLWRSLDGDIESILKLSYDALCEENKDLFLHIACLFNPERVEKVVEHLSKRFSDVRQGLHVLADKSLISMDGSCIGMHDLLEKLGKEVIRKQSIHDPGKRQFLVDARDICEVLNDDTTISRSVIGINSRFQPKGELNASERAFVGMSNLQFLSIYSPDFNFPNISQKLRLLNWQFSSATNLSCIVNPEFLVELNFRHSKLEKFWAGIKPLPNLKWMDLSQSKNLTELPNLSTATSLKELNLKGCSSLVELPSSIGNATNLEYLLLSECSSLVELPSSIGNLHRLLELFLQGCSKLEVLPTNINLESLSRLDLTDCSSLKRFPEISTSIEVLKLRGTAIKEVPPSIRLWSHLRKMDMHYSENLKDFPHAFDSITGLYSIDAEIQELGPWVTECSRLHRLKLTGCRKLKSLPQLSESLSRLGANNCESLERLDCSFPNPDIRFYYINCFKLNQKARDLIIHTPIRMVTILTGGEVPACFNYRASGSSVTVTLNEKPLHPSTKFKVCILLVNKGDNEYVYEFGDGARGVVNCNIKSKQRVLTSWISYTNILETILEEHLYIFDVEAEEVTSTELDFEFKLCTYSFVTQAWEIKECGIFQLLEPHVDEDYSSSDNEV